MLLSKKLSILITKGEKIKYNKIDRCFFNKEYFCFNEFLTKKIENYAKYEPIHTIFCGRKGSGKKFLAYYYLSKYFNVSIEDIMKLTIMHLSDNSAKDIENEMSFPFYLRGHYHFEIDVSFFTQKNVASIFDIIKIIENDRNHDLLLNKSNIIFIKNVDQLKISTQIQLRRILEQIYGKCVLFFFTSNIDYINDTIRSRCIELRLESPTNESIILFMNKMKSKYEEYLTHFSNDQLNKENSNKRGRKRNDKAYKNKTCLIENKINISKVLEYSNRNLTKVILLLQYYIFDTPFINPINQYLEFLKKRNDDIDILETINSLRSYVRSILVTNFPFDDILLIIKNDLMYQLITSKLEIFNSSEKIENFFLLFLRFVNILIEEIEISKNKQYQMELLFLFLPLFFNCTNKSQIDNLEQFFYSLETCIN